MKFKKYCLVIVLLMAGSVQARSASWFNTFGRACMRVVRPGYISATKAEQLLKDPALLDEVVADYSANVKVGGFFSYINIFSCRGMVPLLGYALANNEIAVAQKLIKAGAKLQDPSMHKRTFYGRGRYNSYLDLVIDKKNTLGVQLLLDNGLKIGEQHMRAGLSSPDKSMIAFFKDVVQHKRFLEDGFHPLHCAVHLKEYVLVRALAETIAVDSKDQQGRTPLHIAVQGDDSGMVELLFGCNGSPAVVDRHGNTLLHCAKTVRMARTLLAYGVVPNQSNKDGQLALHKALHTKDSQLIALLCEHTNLQARDAGGNTFLHYAIDAHVHNFASDLMRTFPAMINQHNSAGDTPLHKAAASTNFQLATQLLDAGCLVDKANRSGETPLLKAIIHGNSQLATMLLSRGAQANRMVRDGKTMLFYAVEYANKNNGAPIVRDLMASGALCTVRAQSGDTPLLWALKHRAPTRVVRSVADAAVINLANKEGQTALALARTVDEQRMLLQMGANPNSTLMGGDYTLLHQAAKNLDEDQIALLLEYGAHKNVVNRHGRTPLHEALRNMDGFFTFDLSACRVVRRLAKRSIINMPDSSGKTPLVYAAMIANSSRAHKIIEILLEFGADKKMRCGGKKPYEYAMSLEVKQLLGFEPPQQYVQPTYVPTYTAPVYSRPKPVPQPTYQQPTPSAPPMEEESAMQSDDLHVAARALDAESISIFISKGVAVDAMNAQGCTPLHEALFAMAHVSIARDKADCIIKMLATPQTVNKKDTAGKTPLAYAAALNTDLACALIELLIAKGADRTITCQGRFAYQFATDPAVQAALGFNPYMGGSIYPS